ncbi:MAG: hypothetical protein JOZ39_11165, partial [Chloroflexi bacterium]|nr:hypothetical protein [Chloroflexota bacterium]
MPGTLKHKPNASHRIAPPRPERPPLTANIFEVMSRANCELIPLFPYFHEGAMVPGGSIFRGGKDVDYGHFFHSNSVDEVAMVFGSSGAHVQPGQVYALSRVHGVTSPLRDDADPDSFQVGVITQRQSTGEGQSEAVLFRCKKCGEELYRHDYGADPLPDEHDLPYPGLGTIAGTVAAAESYNAATERHTCPKCGTLNPPFPIDSWGWRRYVEQGDTVNRASLRLDAM